VPRAYDHVFGPAVSRLNADRLRRPPRFESIAFGPQPEAPVLTVVVTLYNRLDFMEYQFGFLSRHRPEIAVEYIYVLDDPAKRREAQALAASIHARFAVPLRLVTLDRNLGFAPANNVGLGCARGEFVCFLNSDVFAGTPDWMERMVARLRGDARLGAVGPLLLFEDDAAQHQGMVFARLPEFGDWHFPMHERKGWRPPAEGGLRECVAITGACMVMRTKLAAELGGFDEAYIIGDFEDSDLCLKLRERGLACAVDLDARLYHLERQSQIGPQHRWRMNLTLHNAWTHERRWAEMLQAEEAVGA
jgi:GT2 family glycosyltransferase